MIAVTIYFLLGVVLIGLLCYAFKRYNKNSPVLTNLKRQVSIEFGDLKRTVTGHNI